MALRFPCPSCKRELSGPESITGSEVQCPSCQTVFLAGDGRGSRAMGIASERHPPAASPVEMPTLYRQRSPDEDHPVSRAEAPPGRSGYWFGLLALLVFAPLAFIGIVTWILMGNRAPTTWGNPGVRPMTTTATAHPSKTKSYEGKFIGCKDDKERDFNVKDIKPVIDGKESKWDDVKKDMKMVITLKDDIVTKVELVVSSAVESR
jgi:hypothetical protein